jgi:hypothetical protein
MNTDHARGKIRTDYHASQYLTTSVKNAGDITGF